MKTTICFSKIRETIDFNNRFNKSGITPKRSAAEVDMYIGHHVTEATELNEALPD